MRAFMLVAVVAIAFVGGCERGGSSNDRRFVGRWLLEPARSDERVSAAELDLRSDGTYRLSLTVDGKANLLENRWTSQGVKVLLGFPADNTEPHINAHGAEMRWPGELTLAYRIKAGEGVGIMLRQQPAGPSPPR